VFAQHPPKKKRSKKKVGSLVVIKQSAQNNLLTILPCGLKVFWVISLDEQLLCLVAYRILIRNIDPMKCLGIGIGAPYLTRQCQFSQLLAIWTCDCNQPTFTSLVGEELVTLSGRGNWKTSCVKIVLRESMEKMTLFLCVCQCIFFLAKFHKIFDLKNKKVAYILFLGRYLLIL
jgi:hypothetical protein